METFAAGSQRRKQGRWCGLSVICRSCSCARSKHVNFIAQLLLLNAQIQCPNRKEKEASATSKNICKCGRTEQSIFMAVDRTMYVCINEMYYTDFPLCYPGGGLVRLAQSEIPRKAPPPPTAERRKSDARAACEAGICNIAVEFLKASLIPCCCNSVLKVP